MAKTKQTIALYPGRFHLFHPGHKASYDQLASKFGTENTFILLPDKTDDEHNPFTYDERVKMMTHAGVPKNQIIKVSDPDTPYTPFSFLKQFDPDKTVAVFGVGKKDMEGDPRFDFKSKKDGQPPSFFQKYKDDSEEEPLEPMGYWSQQDKRPKRAYVHPTSHRGTKIGDKEFMSGSELRQHYSKNVHGEKQQADFVKQLFGGVYNKAIHQIINYKLKEDEPTLDTPVRKHAEKLGVSYIGLGRWGKDGIKTHYEKDNVLHPFKRKKNTPMEDFLGSKALAFGVDYRILEQIYIRGIEQFDSQDLAEARVNLFLVEGRLLNEGKDSDLLNRDVWRLFNRQKLYEVLPPLPRVQEWALKDTTLQHYQDVHRENWITKLVDDTWAVYCETYFIGTDELATYVKDLTPGQEKAPMPASKNPNLMSFGDKLKNKY